MSKPLQRVKKLRAGHPRLWLLSIEDYGKMYNAALKDLGLANLGLTLYALRYAGASYDLLTDRRDYQGRDTSTLERGARDRTALV